MVEMIMHEDAGYMEKTEEYGQAGKFPRQKEEERCRFVP